MSAKAPAAPAAAAADAPVAKGSSKLPMIALGAMVIANLGGTAVIALRSLKADSAKAEHAAKEAKKGEKENLRGPVVPIDTFVVNLNEPGATRYLKTTFEVEVADPAAQKELEEDRRAIRDDVLRYLSNLSLKETMGDTSKARIKEDILARTRRALGDDAKIKNLYFTEFVVQ